MSEFNPEFNTNQVTLKYLANSIYQDEKEKNAHVNKKKEKEEFKFYRKRIHALSKEMLKGKYPNETLKKAHKTFKSSEKIKDTEQLRKQKTLGNIQI